MLETELKNLSAEIASLREAIKTLNQTFLDWAEMEPADAPIVEDAPAPVQEVARLVSTEANPVSREDIQSFCTQAVRKDRSVRQAIMDVIASYDGARSISDVKDADLASLFEMIKEVVK